MIIINFTTANWSAVACHIRENDLRLAKSIIVKPGNVLQNYETKRQLTKLSQFR